ncbi:MAG: SatD family protein [Marmoricola sp.]|jgi:DNA-binding transcriptional LysR family regulator
MIFTVEYTVIGDVIGSRDVADREHLHQVLASALREVNQTRDPLRALRITVGDEFQGSFGDLTQAMAAVLDVRVAMLPEYDIRHGIGWGEVSTIDAADGIEDGPGWWTAREAIVEAESLAAAPATGSVRTRFVGPSAGVVNAALNCRDHLVGSMSAASLRILAGLRDGLSQRTLAEELGISASAVSQRVRRDGIGVIVLSERSQS